MNKTLTKNNILPLTHIETVTSLSSHQFKREELELLKNRFNFSIDSLVFFPKSMLTDK